MNLRHSILRAVIVFTLVSGAHAAGDETGQAFFENKVRPLLVEKCYECHSLQSAKSKGGLLLDSRESLRKGGESGPALDEKHPQASLLLKAVRREDKDLAMPPKEHLSAEEVRVLEQWVAMGAPDPREGSAVVSPMEKRFEDAKSHWAFLALRKDGLPQVRNTEWVRTPIDAFVLRAMELNGLSPSVEADPRTLLRRLHFDLTGLLPSVEEMERFAADPRPEVYVQEVDRLLASPHFGERWGRHWLDLARYADSSGLHNDLDRPFAWKYRDYVIASFNEDKPFEHFVSEQLAGDEIDADSEQHLVATGFCRNGPSNEDNMGNREQYRLDELDDIISTTSSVFLGLSIGCARCHDHKYDPITSEDYYSLLAVFNGTEKLGLPKGSKTKQSQESIPLQALIEKSARVRPTFLLRRGNLSNPGPEVHPMPPRVLQEKPFVVDVPAPEATTSGRRIALARWIASPENALTWRVLANRLWQHALGKPIVASPSNFGFKGTPPTHPELLDYLARELVRNGGRIKPVLREIFLSAAYRQSSAHLESAAAIDPENVWLWRMHRRRMEAEVLRDNILKTSGRLSTEMGGPGIKPRIRAELITASQRNKWPSLTVEGPEQWRRSVYVYLKRQLMLPFLEIFDAPATSESCALRTESVVPTQALVLMNDEFVEDQAAALAKGILLEQDARAGGSVGASGVGDMVASMIQRVLLRPVSDARKKEAAAFVETRRTVLCDSGASEASALERALGDLAHVLFNTSEFFYVD